MSELATRADVVIAGGGHVGLSLAVALAQADPSLTILVADARSGPPGAGDERSSAIAASARRMLEAIGVYDSLAAEAQPILDMIVTDSRTRDASARPCCPSTARSSPASPLPTWCRTR